MLANNEGNYIERTTDPKGNTTEKEYDKTNRLFRVFISDDVTEYDYFPNGNLLSVTYPDGTTESYLYNKNNQVTSLENLASNGAIISSYQYTYDAAGNQLTKTDIKGTDTYTYDSLNRLSSVAEAKGRTISYTYDKAGNRLTEKTSESSNEVITKYFYNNQNKLIRTQSSQGVETRFIYDNNGNLITKVSGAASPSKNEASENSSSSEIEEAIENLPGFGLIVNRDSEQGTSSKDITYYTYDNYNRMSSLRNHDTTAAYNYDAQGYRIEKTINGEITRYLYDADKVVLETDESNNEKASQVYGINLLCRFVAAEEGLEAQSYYYLYNAHGDVTALIDESGNIAGTYDYDVFGNLISQSGDADNNNMYSGYQYDKESGLYYLNARYYDSTIARFISEDSYRGTSNDPLSLNLYTYCYNNPIIYYDPTGHDLVAIKDVMDQNNGSMILNNDNKTVTITANKITKVYNKDDIVMFSGDVIMDDRLFKTDFNYNMGGLFDFRKKLKLDPKKIVF